ncbi:phenylalanine--tRNA ligase subunit beta [Rhodocytophaga aerolata]|uniref:Phenylalanine--tRNA ligase beta subunit n=1 Tax=Rhodocytophaga aerolata TaxID=455078 RepID=A0ABT8R4F7_9BACT|nr:phenylalanine--tRNA ligase subunit beta [Rhodocytophaga aerolata]MDO1446970.1 phenylalanine--tRNA ligase subunit beta [Rhodocytophaga aerolata]
MKISYNWLKQYIQVDESAQEIANLLTRSGLEVEHVEGVESIKGGLQGIVIGEVLTCKKHPEADKLSLTTVDIGNGSVVPIVCGASNVAAGQKVVVATVGATLYPSEGEPLKIKKAKIRGEVSEGMICAEDEIGIGTSHAGIMVLHTDLPNGTPAAKYFNLEPDYVLEIGLTPNRADAASHIGVVRDLKALLHREYQLPSVEAFHVHQTSASIEVIVENTEAAPRYSGVTISNLTVQESPEWLKKRLQSIGLTPINNVVDVTNFVLHELGQPLHAFDAAKITGNKVVVKTLSPGTPFVTLDGQERKLHDTDLMICNAEEPMCIAGVFGGINSGVTTETKAIFLESACFNPVYIRKTSQQHSLKTDASFRFERGTDPNITVYALKRAALLIGELAGGVVTSEIIDIYPQPVANFEVNLLYKNVNRLIGKVLDKDTIKSILSNLDIHITSETDAALQLSIPPYRVDVQREADVIEEILRIYGYDNIEIPDRLHADYLAEFPSVDKNKLQYKITALLSDNGYYEIITNSLTKAIYTEKFAFVAAGQNVEILNKLSEDLGVMRQTLLFSGLEVMAYNSNRRQKELKLFEFGTTYYKTEGKYVEKNRLALFLAGDKQAESWQQKSKSVNFHDLLSTVQKLLQRMHVKNIESKDTELAIFSYGLCYKINNREVANIGLLQPSICKFMDMKGQVFYADIDWDYLLKQYSGNLEVKEVPKYPEVRRDLSLVIDKNISFQTIRQLAMASERRLLKSVNVFDVYEGENIGKEKKSYSVSFILQDENATLTDVVIDKTMQRLMQVFEKELSAVIRK